MPDQATQDTGERAIVDYAARRGEIFAALKEPFPAHVIHWRQQGKISGKEGGRRRALLVPYLDARNVMDRLDEVVGPENWRDSYRDAPGGKGFLCRLEVRIPSDLGVLEWVAREDGADATDIEAVKGGFSDSLKRAAVKWGIGRYLYRLEGPHWVDAIAGYPPTDSDGIRLDAGVEKGKRMVMWCKRPQLPGFAFPKAKRKEAEWERQERQAQHTEAYSELKGALHAGLKARGLSYGALCYYLEGEGKLRPSSMEREPLSDLLQRVKEMPDSGVQKLNGRYDAMIQSSK